MNKGLFISFEGPDGSGKSTQLRLLADWLRQNGYDVVSTREPGGTPISEKIRNVILDPENKEMDPLAEALLYAAARAQHVSQLIKPSIDAGKIVLSDRFMDSSIAYQGYGRGLGDQVRIINEYAVCGVHPDITFFLNIPAEEGRRRNTNTGKCDRLELEAIEFHNRVYDGFLRLSEIYKDRYICIDADRSIEAVAAEIQERLKPILEER